MMEDHCKKGHQAFLAPSLGAHTIKNKTKQCTREDNRDSTAVRTFVVVPIPYITNGPLNPIRRNP